MLPMRFVRLLAMAVLLFEAGVPGHLSAQNKNPAPAAAKTTGYALKKPVFAAACKSCPWGSIADIIKTAMQFYGYDVQICYQCARERNVADAKMPPSPEQLARDVPSDFDMPAYLSPPPPNGPVDFGATAAQYLWDAYRGAGEFANDPEGPRKNLRIIANIQEPSYFIVAVKADSGITDLGQIVEKHMPVHILISTTGRMSAPLIRAAIDPEMRPGAALAYYGITKQKMESFGGDLSDKPYLEDQRQGADVFIGWGALNNAPEYNMWYDLSQRHDLKYLELPRDLRDRMAKELNLEERDMPIGLLRGVDRPIATVARTGNVIYARTDMPDEFAYTLAKAIDEHQDLLQWAQGGMNFSYNSHTVWKAFGVPLHPGAEKYYKEKGYMK
jgi:uncharacterized protein